jgi:hypothetical protein
MTDDIEIQLSRPNHIAVILDNEVVQMMAVDDRLAAILFSEPKFVEATNADGTPGANWGDIYDESSGKFTPRQPYASWSYDAAGNIWVSPVPVPSEGGPFMWDEESLTWKELNLE